MRNTMRVLGIIAVLILIGAGLYWVGLSQGKSQLEAERQNFNSQLQQQNARVVQAEYGGRLNQARFLLCRTAYDLDQRNFGLANTDLKAAGAALGTINPSMLGVDPAVFEALRKDIAGTDINVAVDLEAQRSQVLNYSARLEDMLPKATQSAAAPPASLPAQAASPPAAPPQAAPPQTAQPQAPATKQ